MKLDAIRQIALKTNDIDESRDFYEKVLGARLIATFTPPGLVFYDFAGIRLLLEHGAPEGAVYFHSEDVDADYVELQVRGVEFDSPPHCIHSDVDGRFGAAGEEEWMAFFRDPAGNTLALAGRKAAQR